ncbi:MAG: septum formation initiator family protein [Actinobacteria bacterium]|nr:septum formation initiator family protein [Actinomycetota bacterium]
MGGGADADAGVRTRTGAYRPTVSAPTVQPVRRGAGVRIGHTLGITSPRRTAILAVVVCAMALSVAVPLRNYVSQRSELAMVHEQQQILADQVAELERRRALLADPRHIEAQARQRLRYVRSGETPYVVQLPAPPPPPSTTGDDKSRGPWLTRLWESIVGG